MAATHKSKLDTAITAVRSSETMVDLATTRPGTPGGVFMRQFWHAIHRSEDLLAGQAKPIRIMSENYTLYRGASGRPQVIDNRCPHRHAPMHLAWVEGDDLRCVYHGWKFDCFGQCIEQPAEEAGFARKVRIGSYPTQEYLGLIFAYFGEGQAPCPRRLRKSSQKRAGPCRAHHGRTALPKGIIGTIRRECVDHFVALC